MNYFKEAERILSSYDALCIALENIQRRKARIIAQGLPAELSGFDYSKPYTDANCFNDTYGQFLDFVELKNEEERTEAAISEIKTVLSRMQEDNRRIINLWYIDKNSKEVIAELLGVESTSTVYNRRNMAVGEFALLYFGADALASI